MYGRVAVRGGSDNAASDTAAFSGRKRVAISEDDLAQMGLDDCGDEAPENAKLFWGVEELENVGGGRYYPKRPAFQCLLKDTSHVLEYTSLVGSV